MRGSRRVLKLGIRLSVDIAWSDRKLHSTRSATFPPPYRGSGPFSLCGELYQVRLASEPIDTSRGLLPRHDFREAATHPVFAEGACAHR